MYSSICVYFVFFLDIVCYISFPFIFLNLVDQARVTRRLVYIDASSCILEDRDQKIII